MKKYPAPTREELLAAEHRTIPDVIAPGLKVLFCGINPSLYSAAVGHHFARPGNRFWKALHGAGFSPRLFSPWEDRELLEYGYGITNLAARATAAASDLSRADLEAGSLVLEKKVRRYRPSVLAVLGIGAYREGFGKPGASIGPQAETLGETRLWILPNPSGLNAHYRLEDLAALFKELRELLERPG